MLDFGYGESVSALNPVKLFPIDRCGDRQARPRSRRIRLDRGCGPLIAQKIEEDPAAALRLWERDGEALRCRLGKRGAEGLGELPDARPFSLGVQRHDDVDALSARE